MRVNEIRQAGVETSSSTRVRVVGCYLEGEPALSEATEGESEKICFPSKMEVAACSRKQAMTPRARRLGFAEVLLSHHHDDIDEFSRRAKNGFQH